MHIFKDNEWISAFADLSGINRDKFIFRFKLTNNKTNNEYLPKFIRTDNASSSVITATDSSTCKLRNDGRNPTSNKTMSNQKAFCTRAMHIHFVRSALQSTN